MKILVIDDEKPTLSMFNLFLSAYGYDVFVAENGETGLKMVEEISPDIVFTDIKMPGIDGIEVLRRIRQTNSATQVIVITGHGDMEKALDALDLDASDFINKPVERQALNSALARAEKRLDPSFDETFICDSQSQDSRVKMVLSGRFSNAQATGLKKRVNRCLKTDTKEIHFFTSQGFLITRSGIESLIDIIRQLRREGLRITLENLPYNYAPVFRMADMDKIADLVEEDLTE